VSVKSIKGTLLRVTAEKIFSYFYLQTYQQLLHLFSRKRVIFGFCFLPQKAYYQKNTSFALLIGFYTENIFALNIYNCLLTKTKEK
jgi:hypothetical protein